MQHRPPPDHGLLVGHEESHRQAPHPVDHGGHEQVVEGHRARSSRPASSAPRSRRRRRRATRRRGPGAARATARFTVTDDFPTPPLPEEIPTTRVRDPGAMKRLGRPASCPSGAGGPPGAVRVAVGTAPPVTGSTGSPPGPSAKPAVELLALLAGHGGGLDLHLAHPGQRPHGPDHQVDEFVGVGPAVHGQRHHHRCLAPSRSHGPHHPELAQAAAQRGVFDGRGGGAYVGIGRGHGASLGKGPAARPGITPRPTGRLLVCNLRPISVGAAPPIAASPPPWPR